jgi:hypothetical protein
MVGVSNKLIEDTLVENGWASLLERECDRSGMLRYGGPQELD